MQRIVTQVIMFGVNIVTKSFMQAYQQAKAGGGTASQAANRATAGARMPLDQARQILGVETAAKAGSLTRELVLEQFTRHYEANDVEKGGSFYIQSKVWNAKEVLLEELKKKPSKPAPAAPLSAPAADGGGGGSSRASAQGAFWALQSTSNVLGRVAGMPVVGMQAGSPGNAGRVRTPTQLSISVMELR